VLHPAEEARRLEAGDASGAVSGGQTTARSVIGWQFDLVFNLITPPANPIRRPALDPLIPVVGVRYRATNLQTFP